MSYTESTKKDLDIDQLDSLMDSVGWREHRGEEKWQEILSKSAFVYSVSDGNKMIGFGRILEDGLMCMIYDVMVHNEYQGKGIGKMIMNNLLEYTKDKGYASVSLFAWPENKDYLLPFYKKFGFEVFETAMRQNK